MKVLNIALASLLSVGALADQPTYKNTEDYRIYPRTQLNEKYDTYSKMVKTPKGSDCDWVYVSPELDIEKIKNASVHIFAKDAHREYARQLSRGHILTALERGLNELGIDRIAKTDLNDSIQSEHIHKDPREEAIKAQEQMMAKSMGFQTANQIAMRQVSSEFESQYETNKFEGEKSLYGIDEAYKRLNERKDFRRQEIVAELFGYQVVKTVDPSKPKNPEDYPGYVLVCYTTEFSDNSTSSKLAKITGVNNNYTAAEVILLKDGKPLLAARHRSNDVRVGLFGSFKNSGEKCGLALASAFNAKPVME